MSKDQSATSDDSETQPPLTPLAPERLGPKRILGFRQGLATAEMGDVKIEIDTSIGIGGMSISVHVKRGGRSITESVNLQPMVNEWAQRVAKELLERDADA